MEQVTPRPDEEAAYDLLEQQVRELYGRVIYSHKTHEKAAESDRNKANAAKVLQISLSALVTAGAVTALVVKDWAPMVTALLSATLTALNAYLKNLDPSASAQKHRGAAAELWTVRESYLSLITDLAMRTISIDDARRRRDELQDRLGAIYNTAPPTDASSYKKAQKGLKQADELTFSEEEIDKFLPQALRKAGRQRK
ncbi:SLATT domain-containing protein [Azospirillum soli]|uniref:SLATT domain-containing protein n=1 Tax=Azospirillum soli TaxID=1304799 RepID=UPI001AE562EA|nr:SLATT domain-containing protein [Azospirillum soli]MBP2311491.1 hypothetical protein [Azospirillum soli]